MPWKDLELRPVPPCLAHSMEFQATEAEINKMDHAMHRMDLEEKELLWRLSRIREERAALQAVRYLAVSTLAPIHRLPTELLEHIFVLGTHGYATTIQLCSRCLPETQTPFRRRLRRIRRAGMHCYQKVARDRHRMSLVVEKN